MAPEMKKKPTGLCSLPGGEGKNMGLELWFQWVVEFCPLATALYLAMGEVTQLTPKPGRLTTATRNGQISNPTKRSRY